MQISIGNTASETNRLTKAFNIISTISGELNNDSNVINPTILLNYNEAFIGCNYAYIPAWNRYYYITDIKVVNGMMLLALHVDVLMTYANDIKGSIGHITRSSKGNRYIPDGLATQTENRRWQFRSLGTGFNAGVNYIMTKAGI